MRELVQCALSGEGKCGKKGLLYGTGGRRKPGVCMVPDHISHFYEIWKRKEVGDAFKS